MAESWDDADGSALAAEREKAGELQVSERSVDTQNGGEGRDESSNSGELYEKTSSPSALPSPKNVVKPPEKFCAGLVSEKSRLYRNFRRTWDTLNKEFVKQSPSVRYLAGDLQRAEGLVKSIRELVEKQKELLVAEQLEDKLLDLEVWEQDFEHDIELLADISSFLEQSGSNATPRAEARLVGDERSCSPASPTSVSGRLSGQSLNLQAGQLGDKSTRSHRQSVSDPVLPCASSWNHDVPVQLESAMASLSTAHICAGTSTLTQTVGDHILPLQAPVLSQAMGNQHAMGTIPGLTSESGNTSIRNQPEPISVHTPGYQRYQPVHTNPVPSMPAMTVPPLGFRPIQSTTAASLMPTAPLYSHASAGTGRLPYVPASLPVTTQMQPVSLPATRQIPGYPWPATPSYPLQPLKIPKFNGREDDYLQWRQRFMRAVDNTWMSEDHKLDRLRESLEGGKAEPLIAGVLDGPGAYLEAWRQLESWYGGQDRHIERQIRAIMEQKKITNDTDLAVLQSYAVKLQNTLATMNVCGTRPGPELYLIATERVPREVLMKFFAAHGEHTTDVQVFTSWLVNYLRTMKRAADRVGATEAKSATGGYSQRHSSSLSRPARQSRTMLSSEPAAGPQCRKCQKGHAITDCSEFKSLPVSKRWDLARMLNLCVCCLRSGHWAAKCEKMGCSKCSSRHHDLLHREPGKNKRESASTSECRPVQKATTAGSIASASVAFMAVSVKIKENKSREKVTALLDSGSNCSYVTEELAIRLNLTGPTEAMEVAVLGGDTLRGRRQRVTLHVCHEASTQSTPVEAWIIPQITTDLEVVEWNREKHNWPHLSDIDFSSSSSGHVDLLIGLDAAELHASYEERRHEGGPIARRTPMGWIGFGPQSADAHRSTTLLATHTSSDQEDRHLSRLVCNFWELEAVGMNPPPADYLTPNEKQAEQQTTNSMIYDGERYQMGIPWVHGYTAPDISCDQSFAECRLNSLISMLEKKPDVKLKYAKVLQDHLEKGYIRHVPTEEVKLAGSQQWFLPHFPIVRNDKATTKVRVVFDAAAEYKGISINNQMHAGPKLQNDLVAVLLRFCAHAIALAGDISEMFLQVRLRPEDRKYHRFLWRDTLDSPIEVLEFLRLAFGIRASPYLAGRALKATAEDAGDKCSYATREAIDKNFYVDDFLHSLCNEEVAKATRAEVQAVVANGGFQLRKWASNSPEVLNSIPSELRSQSATVNISDNESVVLSKTLGVTWSPRDDTFSFNFPVPEEVTFTRRGVLRQFAKLFDPRGQLQPFTIRSRVLFQEICIRGKDWDEPLDEDHCRRWQRWFSEFPSLSGIAIERSFRSSGSTAPLSLHTYTDASEFAYAAATYVREDGDPPRVTLAMARARPSPIKRRSIPMLELQGAVLGVRLACTVASALGVDSNACYFWTDSMNVLYWVRSPSRKFKMDVGRRIAEIQEQSVSKLWQHVPGRLNPADKATRGLSAAQLGTDEVWFHGPSYLSGSAENWPKKQIIVPPEVPGMSKSTTPATFTSVGHSGALRLHPDRYSSWRRLSRVTAWCIRVVRARCTELASNTNVLVDIGKREAVAVPELTPEEIERAEHVWIGRAQQDTYPATCQALAKGVDDQSGKLVKLQPFMDQAASVPLLRVGGRLKEARHLPPSLRSPIILPRDHRVTELIIQDEDNRCGHAVGTNHLLSNLSTRYWIVKGRAAVKALRNKCVSCKKQRASPATPLMGPLPNFRTSEPLRAFAKTGMDYAGPFMTRQGRGRAQMKRYTCVFTCLVTRACHFEMVYSLETDGVLMALTRFCKRRCVPVEIVSDNGSNLVAANKEMRIAVEALDAARISNMMTGLKVRWRFNPPAAPHFGGVFETVVKSMKRVLQNVLYRADLNDEELHTALVQAEALINSRPLTTLSTDVEDPAPLTPQHFLAGHSEMTLPVELAADLDGHIHPRRRWKYIQSLLQMVWKRWLHEIVPKLNVRAKWRRQRTNVQKGDVLLVMEKNTPRSHWPLGRVVDVHPGADGIVRVIDVRICGKVYRRPVKCMIPLEVDAV